MNQFQHNIDLNMLNEYNLEQQYLLSPLPVVQNGLILKDNNLNNTQSFFSPLLNNNTQSFLSPSLRLLNTNTNQPISNMPSIPNIPNLFSPQLQQQQNSNLIMCNNQSNQQHIQPLLNQ